MISPRFRGLVKSKTLRKQLRTTKPTWALRGKKKTTLDAWLIKGIIHKSFLYLKVFHRFLAHPNLSKTTTSWAQGMKILVKVAIHIIYIYIHSNVKFLNLQVFGHFGGIPFTFHHHWGWPQPAACRLHPSQYMFHHSPQAIGTGDRDEAHHIRIWVQVNSIFHKHINKSYLTTSWTTKIYPDMFLVDIRSNEIPLLM